MYNLDFPLGPRAEITPTLLDTIAQQYGFGPVLTAHDLGGCYNLNAAIQTPQGPFVVRVYRPWVTQERLYGIQHVKHLLHACQMPVVLPCTTTDGQTLIVYDERVAEVEPFVQHEQTIETWQHYREAFAFLRQLHSELSHLTKAAMIPPPLVENYGLPRTLLDWIAQAKQIILKKHDPRVPAALVVCTKAETLLQELDLWWEGIGHTLPKQLIHGDYGIGNILFDRNRVVGVIDLEFIAVHERVYDLAYALFWMFEYLEPAVAYNQRSWQQVQEMVHCYQVSNQNPLTQAEIDAVPVEIARVPLYWVAEAAWLPDPIEAVLSGADVVAFSEWLLSHQSVITRNWL